MRMNWIRRAGIVVVACASCSLTAAGQTSVPQSDSTAQTAPTETTESTESQSQETRSAASHLEQERQRFEAFMREHSPRRWAFVQRMSDSPWQGRIREGLEQRFRGLERLRNVDAEMHAVNLRRLAIEDDIFGITYRALRVEGRALTEEERSKLRERVTALIDISLEERQVRVQQLRELLNREEGLLAGETAQRDATIAERFTTIEQNRGRISGGPFGKDFGTPRDGYGGGPVGPPPGGERPSPDRRP